MKNEKLYTEKTIKTISGHYINVFDPDPETIDIIDIAHSLSQTPRWGGHLKHFYSVAQHSIKVCENLPDNLKLEGLLHDATEAYIGDIPKPIKRGMPDYNLIEKNLDVAIRKKFNLDLTPSILLKEADKKELEWEWETLKLNHINCYSDMNLVRDQFLQIFRNLTND
jgi:hypothetical protein